MLQIAYEIKNPFKNVITCTNLIASLLSISKENERPSSSFLIDLRHIPSDNSPTSPTKSFEKDFLNWEEQKLQR